jgi:hypothetical protein
VSETPKVKWPAKLIETVARAICRARGQDPDWTGGGKVAWWTTHKLDALYVLDDLAPVLAEVKDAAMLAAAKEPTT